MVFEPLIDDPQSLVCRRDDPLAEIADPNWADLAGLRLVAVHKGSGNRTSLDAGLGRAGIKRCWFYEVTRLTSALALVQAGAVGPTASRLRGAGGARSGVAAAKGGGSRTDDRGAAPADRRRQR